MTSSNQKFRKNLIDLQARAVQELSFGDKIKVIDQPSLNKNTEVLNKETMKEKKRSKK